MNCTISWGRRQTTNQMLAVVVAWIELMPAFAASRHRFPLCRLVVIDVPQARGGARKARALRFNEITVSTVVQRNGSCPQRLQGLIGIVFGPLGKSL